MYEIVSVNFDVDGGAIFIITDNGKEKRTRGIDKIVILRIGIRQNEERIKK